MNPTAIPTASTTQDTAAAVRALCHKLQEISTSASIAAQALDGCACDWLAPELGRLLGRLDAVAEGLADVCDRLSDGKDPQAGRTNA
jgi:hypothetical protein